MSYAKMMGTMRRNPHCFGADDKKRKDIVLGGCPNPLDVLNPNPPPKCIPVESIRTPQFRANQFPGGGKKKKPVLINRPPMPGRRRGLSPMQRRNEQGLRKVKAR